MAEIPDIITESIPSIIDQFWLDLRQLAKDEFGDQYQFNLNDIRSTRAIGRLII